MVIKIILLIALIISSIIAIVAVCMQKPREIGLGAGLSGGNGVSFRHSVQRHKETRLMAVAGAASILVAVLSVVFLIVGF